MLETTDELKNFILWAKEQKIQQLKINDLEVVFHPLAMADGLLSGDTEEAADLRQALENFSKDVTEEDEEDLLFHSSEG